ncbi:hypothetical protein TNCV_2425721 [Trichonephila clavipes]|nr:hypothetical protein TNCV_2425721 [Trichonephila clavipes]
MEFPAVRSAGYKCLLFLLVMKCARLYFGIAFYEMFSWSSQLCEKYRSQVSPVPACVRSAVFPDFQVSSARIPECFCVVLYKFEGNRTTEISEPVNKCWPLINPVVNKSVENATSCDFKNENCDPPVRWTNVFPPSEVRGRGTEKNNLFKIEEGKEFNVYRNSDCEVKVKAGLCDGSVKAVAMGAQRVINPDNIRVALLN